MAGTTAEMAEAAGGAVPASLHEIVARGQAVRAEARLLPVVPPIAELLPEPGLRRGTTVAVSGSTSLLLTLLAAPSRDGMWCAVVGLPSLGVVAAAEAGLALERLVLVPEPGPRWPAVVAALLDVMDVVVVRPPASACASGRRLAARARQRGALLLPVGDWEGADLRLSVEEVRWEGLGQGYGRLRARRALVRVQGRGSAARPRRAWLEETWPATAWALQQGFPRISTRAISTQAIASRVARDPASRVARDPASRVARDPASRVARDPADAIPEQLVRLPVPPAQSDEAVAA